MVLIGAAFQVAMWVSITLMFVSPNAMSRIPSFVRELAPDPLWAGPASNFIFSVSLTIHAICLYFFVRRSNQKPSLLLVLGWALSASACSGFAVLCAMTLLSYKLGQTEPQVFYAIAALGPFVLIGVPVACWISHQRPNATGRRTLWVQTILHIPIIIPVIAFLFMRTLVPSDLFLFDLWGAFGFPLLVIITNLLTLLLSYPRHRRLLLLLQPIVPTCPACTYNITGLPTTASTSCPECGTALPPNLRPPQATHP
jgi:hypothetical protein